MIHICPGGAEGAISRGWKGGRGREGGRARTRRGVVRSICLGRHLFLVNEGNVFWNVGHMFFVVGIMGVIHVHFFFFFWRRACMHYGGCEQSF